MLLNVALTTCPAVRRLRLNTPSAKSVVIVCSVLRSLDFTAPMLEEFALWNGRLDLQSVLNKLQVRGSVCNMRGVCKLVQK